MKSHLLLLSLLVIATLAYGQSEQAILIQDFRGGMNLAALPHSLPTSVFTVLQNVILTDIGVAKKRYGFTHATKQNTGTNVVQGMFIWIDKDTSKLVTADKNGTVRWTKDSTWTTLSTGLTANTTETYDFAVFDTMLVICNGRDAPQKWNGSTTTLSALAGSPQTQRFVRMYKNYLFLGGAYSTSTGSSEPNRNRITFSALGNAESWGANDYIDIEPNDGDQITGLEVLNDNLLIFKRRAIYALSGDGATNFIIRRLVSGVGVVAPRSIRVSDNLLFFLAEDGIYQLDAGGLSKISEPLGTLFGDQTATAITWSAMPTSCAAVLPRQKQYWLAVPINSATTPNRLYVYQYDVQAWTEFRETFFTSANDFAVNAFACGPQVGAQPTTQVVYAGYQSGFRVFRYPQPLTNGDVDSTSTAGITITITTGNLQGGMPNLDKHFRYCYVTTVADSTDTLTVAGKSMPVASGTATNRIDIMSRGKSYALTITNASKYGMSLGNLLILYLPQQWQQ